MSRPLRIDIDLSALRANVQRVRTLAPGCKILAMVKANAYGHGLIPIAYTLADQVEGLGVACLEEAKLLRQAGIQQKIVLMEGFFSQEELRSVSELELDTVIHTAQQFRTILQGPVSKPLSLWLKINTGMNRLGFAPELVSEIWSNLTACSWVQTLYLMTHFSSADLLDKTTTLDQMQYFISSTHRLNAQRSCANSAAIIAWPQTHADWVRPGLILYGVSPFAKTLAQDYQLKPVMTIRSKIITIIQVRAGDCIGYGATWTAPSDQRVGIVAIGYGDGYPYTVQQGAKVLLNDQHVPLLGTVSMDMIAIDLKTQPQAKVGDSVILWGKGLPIETVAQATQRSTYELLCGINRGQLIRTYIKETSR